MRQNSNDAGLQEEQENSDSYESDLDEDDMEDEVEEQSEEWPEGEEEECLEGEEEECLEDEEENLEQECKDDTVCCPPNVLPTSSALDHIKKSDTGAGTSNDE